MILQIPDKNGICRRNYLFCDNDAFAYRTAIVYLLINTCKAPMLTREPR